MSEQAGILPKLFSNWGIILAKGQLDHCYTFWTMPILVFNPPWFLLTHTLSTFYTLVFCLFSSNVCIVSGMFHVFSNVAYYNWKQNVLDKYQGMWKKGTKRSLKNHPQGGNRPPVDLYWFFEISIRTEKIFQFELKKNFS